VARDTIRFRYASEATGFIVLLALALFAAAVIQAGVLQNLLRPSIVLRIILPEQGVGGLGPGSVVEILGTRAGEVTRIVTDPSQQMHAQVRLDEGMQAYVRRDSQAVIRRRFGIAGESYLDISRGAGEPLDWHYAVLTATLDRPPTENLGAIVDEFRQKLLPVIDDMHRSVQLLATMMGRLERGEGTVGRLLADDRLGRDIEAMVTQAKDTVQATGTIMAHVEKSLVDMQSISRDLTRTTRQLPGIARSIEETSRSLPTLLLQTQATATELQQLVIQLRQHWLFGNASENMTNRLPTTEVRP